ncbi:MAG: hypothetical protein JSU04_13685 [Bdellovibrionales bacterium]|nr:hypothetical protein [Bdellovibrionales bacterium]
MLRWTLLVSAMVFTQQSMASWGASPLDRELVTSSYRQQFDGIQNQVQVNELRKSADGIEVDMNAATDVSQIIDKKYGDKCENFAGDGELNKWGQAIEKEFDKDRHQALYGGPSDVRRLCPKYDELNDEDKKGLWVLIISAMTHYESTCIVSESARGPHGTAAGLLQLHRGKEANYSSGCRNGDSNTAERSIICGMSMLNDQIERGEPLFSRKSYWDVLRPQGASQKSVRIQAVIGQYPACKTGKSTDGTTQLDIQPDPKTAPSGKSSKRARQQSQKAPSSNKKARVANSNRS